MSFKTLSFWCLRLKIQVLCSEETKTHFIHSLCDLFSHSFLTLNDRRCFWSTKVSMLGTRMTDDPISHARSNPFYWNPSRVFSGHWKYIVIRIMVLSCSTLLSGLRNWCRFLSAGIFHYFPHMSWHFQPFQPNIFEKFSTLTYLSILRFQWPDLPFQPFNCHLAWVSAPSRRS